MTATRGERNRITARVVEPGARGFSLVELLVAVAMFTVISASAFVLFNQQQKSALTEQGQVGLNVSLRNAASQLQMDLANAGSGYFPGANIPSWPVGVTIVNHVVSGAASCYNAATLTYTANCFDALNIIAAANPAAYPPINATDGTGQNGTGNCSNTGAGIAYGQAAPGHTLAQTAADYETGDQLLFLNNTGSKITSVVLTRNAVVSGSAVQFTFNPTNGDGSNSLANDPLDITACDGNQPCPAGNKLGVQFCGGDWALKLAPITYQVDSSNPADPKLTRTQSGATAIVMEQVIGFKVGATIWNNGAQNESTSAQYNYAASTYTINTPNDEAYNFTLVRSVRISLIGRTNPASGPAYTFRNAFDGGPYQVLGIAVVVNPRNLSMND
ncbi:MAG TPA: prepilin-type N-terminal cleavage/methylation domain-containing protein [Terriglobia bacterium]|nr:prepilin-type N-terminal cleavage/methylation domain-containing protein [Terriglobia bacterium]